jgi:hypothetical protein
MLKQKFRHGFSDAEWESGKKEARAAMIEAAKHRAMITYSDLVAKKIGAIKLDAHDSRLDHLLGEIASEEHEAGRGMLTVVVVHKVGDMEPGPGFYELARRMGIRVSNKQAFWVGELHKVHAAWSEK